MTENKKAIKNIIAGIITILIPGAFIVVGIVLIYKGLKKLNDNIKKEKVNEKRLD